MSEEVVEKKPVVSQNIVINPTTIEDGKWYKVEDYERLAKKYPTNLKRIPAHDVFTKYAKTVGMSYIGFKLDIPNKQVIFNVLKDKVNESELAVPFKKIAKCLYDWNDMHIEQNSSVFNGITINSDWCIAEVDEGVKLEDSPIKQEKSTYTKEEWDKLNPHNAVRNGEVVFAHLEPVSKKGRHSRAEFIDGYVEDVKPVIHSHDDYDYGVAD